MVNLQFGVTSPGHNDAERIIIEKKMRKLRFKVWLLLFSFAIHCCWLSLFEEVSTILIIATPIVIFYLIMSFRYTKKLWELALEYESLHPDQDDEPGTDTSTQDKIDTFIFRRD